MDKSDLRVVDGATSYKVEAIVTVHERGQMVLPKELRDRAGIGPGDKIAWLDSRTRARSAASHSSRSTTCRAWCGRSLSR